MTHTHRFESKLRWRGSTAVGYESYGRAHRGVLPLAGVPLMLSSDAAFLGDPSLANPEQLLVASASSCQLLESLALAARSRIEVLAYRDQADGVMPEASSPMRITQITLRPADRRAPGTDLDRIRRLVDRAHDGCFVANTLNAAFVIEPTISHAAQALPAA
jgi:organic hydroperoxide reductase OsmC/OhrA